MRIATSLKASLGTKGIKYWLQIHGNCPNCPNRKAPSPAPAEDRISKATFFRHALDARGLRILIASTTSGTAIQIVDTDGSLAELERSGVPRRSELARMITREPDPACSVESALRAVFEWANHRDYTLVKWSRGEFSLRYADSFGGPGELRD